MNRKLENMILKFECPEYALSYAMPLKNTLWFSYILDHEDATMSEYRQSIH